MGTASLDAGGRRRAGARFALATGLMPLEGVVAAAREAEALGYEAVLVGEARLEADAFVTAGAVLGATSAVRCGPGIANAYDRHPVALARAAAALDRVARGRALLGVGRSERAYVEETLGVPWAPSPLQDTVRIARELLAGRRVDHDGARWSAHAEAPPERTGAAGRVPVLLAAVGPRALRLAGAAADGVLLNYGAPLEYVRRACAEVREAASAAGRDPDDVDVYGYLLVACDGEREDSVRRTLAALAALPDQATALGLPPHVGDDDLRRHAVVGTRDECLARIEEYRTAGVRCPVLMPSAMRVLHGMAGGEPVAMIPT